MYVEIDCYHDNSHRHHGNSHLQQDCLAKTVWFLRPQTIKLMFWIVSLIDIHLKQPLFAVSY